jgi:hypothetical protein
MRTAARQIMTGIRTTPRQIIVGVTVPRQVLIGTAIARQALVRMPASYTAAETRIDRTTLTVDEVDNCQNSRHVEVSFWWCPQHLLISADSVRDQKRERDECRPEPSDANVWRIASGGGDKTHKRKDEQN